MCLSAYCTTTPVSRKDLASVCNICLLLIVVFRVAETSQDVISLRPPRFIHDDGVIRPYKEREGIGNQMLQVGNILNVKIYSYFIFHGLTGFLLGEKSA